LTQNADQDPGAFTIAGFLSHVLPAPNDGAAPTWPPDAFAVAASLLKRSGAYTEIVNAWPPDPHRSVEAWHHHVGHISRRWRQRCMDGGPAPSEINEAWKTISASGSLEIGKIGFDRTLVRALALIVAVADEACFGFGIRDLLRDAVDSRAISNLTKRNTLCEAIHYSYMTVLPKVHNPVTGMTLRSLTHNLALWDRPEVSAKWAQVILPNVDHGLNVLLVPWPLKIPPRAFRDSQQSCDMPPEFGFFTYEMPTGRLDVDRVRALFDRAEELVGTVDMVIFPELSISQDDFDLVREALAPTLVVAGIGGPAEADALGRNDVAIAIPTPKTQTHIQSKHHRWRLDGPQIAQYGFGPALAKHEYWWEAIRIPQRSLTVFAAKKWLTFSVLLCEDLARQDPVAELVRSLGPNLLIALLMDGPQIPERWSARYATVLAEDPRCSVLTLTCAGMVDLARSQRPDSDRGPRSIALWRDALSGQARPILLETDAEGVVVSLSHEMRKEWSADGRHDDASTGYLLLQGVHQVSPRQPAAAAVSAASH
jgi:hypothetical protein